MLCAYGIQVRRVKYACVLAPRGLNNPVSRCYSHCDCGPLGPRLFHTEIDFGHNVRRELFQFVLWQRFDEKIADIPPSFVMMKNCNQKIRTSTLFDRLALMLSVANPSATVLFTRIDVRCWGYPSSVNVLRNWAPFCAFWNAALTRLRRRM
jgi:hypothetical protein